MPRRPLPEFQDRWLKQVETSELIKVSVPALEADRQNGTLGVPYYKFNSRIRYRLSEVIAWAEARRVVPPVPPGHQTVDDDEPDDVLTRRPARRGKCRKLESAAAEAATVG